jgi:hypothetical protein
MEESERLIAVCGLDCAACPLLKAATDEGAAQHLVGWFKHEGWLKEHEGVAEVMARGPYCKGCRGDRSIHWSANCWILKCCVDDKGLRFCHECDAFPCQRLKDWSTENEQYAQALERLRRMRQEAPARGS